MNDKIKNYKAYNSVDPEDIEKQDIDISNYPQDAYIRPGEGKVVGKLDDYNKEKNNYQNQKSKIILKESNIAPQEKSLDDLIPADIGNAIDSVFSKVDNLLNATGKLFFGGNRSPKKSKDIKMRVTNQPQQQIKSNDIRIKDQKVQGNSAVISPANTYTQNSIVQTPQTKPATLVNTNQNAYKSSIVKPVSKTPAKLNPEEIDNSPLVTRTTMISDLDLPIELLNDPDLVKYFDQMKLYDKKVDGGLCSLTQKQAENILKKGRWGKLFMVSYDQLKINTIMSTADAGTSRFNGMSAVYKAQGRKFANTDELRKAVEKDVNMYIKTGQGSEEFHKFTYRRK